ncbi:MAG: histidinol dehydrogenase, partial [Candidatus Rokubacteria bacterium]|nr:histidinol dehydrogenase [Candidatus Rokubacteria bacterium]
MPNTFGFARTPLITMLSSASASVTAGIRFTPLDRVGVYVPSGKGRFPSTSITIVTPAAVAGVSDIRVLVPPRPDGSVDPALLVACDLLGVRTVYRCNGVAGLAAFALGTETIPQ